MLGRSCRQVLVTSAFFPNALDQARIRLHRYLQVLAERVQAAWGVHGSEPIHWVLMPGNTQYPLPGM